MTKNKVAIQETVELPSMGIVYENVPAKITMRAMTTLEEKIRLASTGNNKIPNLINACIVEPEGIDVRDMKLFDLEYLLYRLRVITYGPEYKLSLSCMNCGTRNDIVENLDNIEVHSVPNDFKEPLLIGPLPVSGDTIEARILTANDFNNIEDEAKRIRSKMPDYVGDPEFILMYQHKFVKINGETVPPYKVQKYIEDMHARDMRYFDFKYDELLSSVGMDLDRVEKCKNCGGDISYRLLITDEFFRPTF